MRIVVTGGTGFIGRAVVTRLRAAGHDVVAASRHGAVPVDVTDPASLEKAFAGAEVVVNAAQFQNFPIENPRKGRTFMEVDARGTEHQVAAAQKAGVRRFVYVSGIGADPDGRFVWWRAKAQGEAAVRASGLEWAIVRPSWVYGPGDRALNRFVGLSRIPVVMLLIGNGRQRINPVFVDDVAAVVGACATEEVHTDTVVEVGGPVVATMEEIVRTMLRVLERRRRVVHLPAGFVKFGAFFLQALPGPPLRPAAIEFVLMDAVADTTTLEERFDVPLTPLAEGLATYLTP